METFKKIEKMEEYNADQLAMGPNNCQVVDSVAAGDNAVVVIVNMIGHTELLALKIITNDASQEDILKETNIQIYASENGIAPRVFGYTSNIWDHIQNPDDLIKYMKAKLATKILRKIFKRRGRGPPNAQRRGQPNAQRRGQPNALQGIVMEIIQPIWLGDNDKDTITPHHQQQLVSKTWRMIKLGIIHNDLHQGNVGILNGNACIYDFGEAEFIDPERVALLPLVVIRQLLVSQLYSLLTREGCNHNNNIDLCGDRPIHNAIYYVKSHTEDDIARLNNMINFGSGINPPVATFTTYKLIKK
jgi:predicted Ser/Thr protein kinase